MANAGATEGREPSSGGSAAHPEPVWIFVGDFLFYLRLLARQFSDFSKEKGVRKRSMVITPEPSMAWEQLETGACEVVTMDVAESTAAHREFLSQLKSKHPDVRCILVSANLNREMEAELMEAGADLCFSKPRSLEEASSVFHLVDALVRHEAPAPSGSLPGLPPARFIQFLCARKESGSISLDTEWGEASLVLDHGKIVDASLGDLTGDAAAGAILSLNATQRCLFKNVKSSRYHTIKLKNHELWLHSGRPKAATEPISKIERTTLPAKSLAETMSSLESLEKSFLNVHVEADPASGDGQVARVSQMLADGRLIHPPEEIVVNKLGAVVSSSRCASPSDRAEVASFLRGKGEEIRSRLATGPSRSVNGEEAHGQWHVFFRPEVSEFRLTGGPAPATPPAREIAIDPLIVMERLAALLGKGPVRMFGYFDVRSDTAWNVSQTRRITEETRERGVMHCLAAAHRKLVQKELPVRKVIWEFDGCSAFVHRLDSANLVLAACHAAPPGEFERLLETLLAELNTGKF